MQVVAGIQDDEQADYEDQTGEEQGQAVQAEGEAETELRKPGPCRDDGVASEDRGGALDRGAPARPP